MLYKKDRGGAPNEKKLLLVGTALGALLAALLLFGLGLALIIGISQRNSPETFMGSSLSPDGQYTLEAYKTQPGATVDFSIKVYIKTDSGKELIYNAYHEYSVEMEWLSNSRVCINGKTLDLSENETYDWRDD